MKNLTSQLPQSFVLGKDVLCKRFHGGATVAKPGNMQQYLYVQSFASLLFFPVMKNWP